MRLLIQWNSRRVCFTIRGFLSFQLSGSTGNGWGGSYLDVKHHEDGTVTTSTIFGLSTFANINDDPDLAIVYGDSIRVTYISADPSNDEFLPSTCSIVCRTASETTPTHAQLRRPVLWPIVLRPSAVSSAAGFGSWEETSNLGNNTFYQPRHLQHGVVGNGIWVVQLYFENECGIESCYEVEVSDVPAIELSEDVEVWVCGDDILDLTAFVTDPRGGVHQLALSGQRRWTQNDYTWTQYSTPTVVTVTNGCGKQPTKWR